MSTVEERRAKAHELVAAGARLLDVRTDEEFRERHLEGALNIPLQILTPETLRASSEERRIVVYCRSGVRSATAAAKLREAEYEVFDLGGIDTW